MINLVIPGFPKCGTSTLAHNLNYHNDIYARGGTRFFCNNFNYKKDKDYYEGLFKKNKIICEKEPAYSYELFFRRSAKRLFKYNPNLKLIWMYRNPVKRAYSDYWYYVRKGREHRSFKEALKKEKSYMRAPGKNYLSNGCYSKVLEYYLKYFSIEQMHFILFEDFIREPKKEIKKIFDFLSISTNGLIYDEKIRNKGRAPRSKKTLYFSNKMFGENSSSFKLIKKINLILGNKNKYPKMDIELQEDLYRFYADYNAKLEELTNLDISKWNS